MSMKIVKAVLVVVACFVFGCGQNTPKEEVANEIVTDTGESFESFIKQFNADPVFRRSRVVFPFKVVQTGQGINGSDTTIDVATNDWQQVNFIYPGDSRNIVDQSNEKSGVVVIKLMVEDTGVYLEHFFERKDGKWWLVYVKDSSN